MEGQVLSFYADEVGGAGNLYSLTCYTHVRHGRPTYIKEPQQLIKILSFETNWLIA